MKFAFNIDFPDRKDFLSKCVAAGITEARIHVEVDSSNSVIQGIASDLAENGMKAALVLKYEIEGTGDSDETLLQIRNNPNTVINNYDRIAQAFPVDQSLGVVLPVGMHMAVKSRYFTRFGMHRTEAINFLNRISQKIKAAGHDVAMPVIFDDLNGDLWKGVSCDIYDVEMLLSRSVALSLSSGDLKTRLDESGKRVWFGRAGTAGGHNSTTAMVKTLKRLKDYSKNANIEYAFLWSKAEVPGFHWSKDGTMMVDVLQQSFINLNQ